MDIIEIIRLFNSRDIFRVNKFIQAANNYLVEKDKQNIKPNYTEGKSRFIIYLLTLVSDPLGIFIMFLYFHGFFLSHNLPHQLVLPIVMPLFPVICILLSKFLFNLRRMYLFRFPFIIAGFSSFFYDMILFPATWMFLTDPTFSLPVRIAMIPISLAIFLRPYLIDRI